MLENLIRFSYPYPISSTYQNIESIVYPEEMPHKYNRIIDLYDSILKVLTYSMVSFALNRRTLNRELRENLDRTLKNPLPSNWTNLMEELIKQLKGSNDPLINGILHFYYGGESKLPKIREAVYYMLDKSTPAREVREMTVSRFFDHYNRFISRADLSSFDYNKAVNVLLPAFREVLLKLEFLKDFTLVYVRTIQVEGRRFDHTLEVMSGLAPTKKRYLSDHAMYEGNRKMYLFLQTEEGLKPRFCLHPFVVIHRCGIHNKDEIYFLRYKDQDEMDYYCFQCRERFRPDRLLIDYQDTVEGVVEGIFEGVSDEVIEIFRELLRDAWKEGVITDEERSRLEYLRNHFDINKNLARNMEEIVKQDLGIVGVELDLRTIKTYRELIQNSIIKAKIITPLRNYIDRFREESGIPEDYARKIESQIWYDEGMKHYRSNNTESARTCFFNAHLLDESNQAANEKIRELTRIERRRMKEEKEKSAKITGAEPTVVTPRAPATPVREKEPVGHKLESGGPSITPKAVEPVEKKLVKEPLVKVTDTIYHPRGKSKILKGSRVKYPGETTEQRFTRHTSGRIYRREYEEEPAGSPIEYEQEYPGEYTEEYPEMPPSSEIPTEEIEVGGELKEEVPVPDQVAEEPEPEKVPVLEGEETEEKLIEEIAGEIEEEIEGQIREDLEHELLEEEEVSELEEIEVPDLEQEDFEEKLEEKVEEAEEEAEKLVEEELKAAPEPEESVTGEEEAEKSEPEEDEEILSLEEAIAASREAEISEMEISESGEISEIELEEPEAEPEKSGQDEEPEPSEEDFEIEVPSLDFEKTEEEPTFPKITEADTEVIEKPTRVSRKKLKIRKATMRHGVEGKGEKETEPVEEKKKVRGEVETPHKKPPPPSSEDSHRVASLLKKSKQLLQDEDYQQARQLLDKIIEIDPDNLPAKLLRGKSALEEGDFEQAYQDTEDVMKFKRDDPTLLMLHGKAALEIEYFDTALEDFEKVIKKTPQKVEAYFQRGSVYLDMGEFEKAISDFTLVLKHKPEDVESYVNRGTCWMELKEYDKALDDFKKASKLDPGDPYAIYKQGLAYHQIGDHARAIELIEKAIELDPEDIDYHVSLSKALADRGEVGKAIDCLKKIHKKNPDSPLVLRALGKMYEKNNQKKKAVKVYTMLSKLEDEEADGYALRGKVYAEMGESKKAFEDFEEALKIDQENVLAKLFLANALVEVGEYDRAIDAYTQVLGLDPYLAEAYLNRGIAYEKKGDVKQAKRDFKNFLQVNRISGKPEY